MTIWYFLLGNIDMVFLPRQYKRKFFQKIMIPTAQGRYIAFSGTQQIACGNLEELIYLLKKYEEENSGIPFLVFDEENSAQIEINLHQPLVEILENAEKFSHSDKKFSAPGRPKLGVISREVSLLPRHWEWLALHSCGISAALRKLVEEEKRRSAPHDEIRKAQEATHKFLTAIAGNMPKYEEALRALYARNKSEFDAAISSWAEDIRRHAQKLAHNAF